MGTRDWSGCPVPGSARRFRLDPTALAPYAEPPTAYWTTRAALLGN